MNTNVKQFLNSGFRFMSRITPNLALWIRQYLAFKHERDFFIKRFGDFMNDSNFGTNLQNLINGLDNESVITVNNIISRYYIYTHKKSMLNPLKLFTKNEITELKLCQKEFFCKCYKKSKSLYVYKEYKFSENHFESSVLYSEHGIEHIENIDLIKEKAIIDVGGYIGDSLVILTKLTTNNIYTFEAVSDNFKLLKDTIKLNNLPNIIPENTALGSSKGVLQINTNGASSSVKFSDFNNSNKNIIEVPVITLDEYVKENNIQVGLIKVDIEGAEPDFLIGAKKTIYTQKPTILLSIYHNAHDFFMLKPLIESWDLGYKFKIYKPTDGAVVMETLLICEIR